VQTGLQCDDTDNRVHILMLTKKPRLFQDLSRTTS